MEVVVIDVTDQHHVDRQQIGGVDGNPYHARSARPPSRRTTDYPNFTTRQNRFAG